MGCLVRNETSTSHPSLRLMDHREKGGENIIQARGRGGSEKTASCGYGRTITPIRSQPLRVPVQHPHMSKLVNVLEWSGKGS